MILKEAEFAIVGSGFIGLALAINLLQQGHSVALVGKHLPKLPHPGNRCVALNLASKSYLEALGVWQELPSNLATPYHTMQVWEKDTNAKLSFNNKSLGLNELGYIVINQDLEAALWQRLNKLASELAPTQFSYIEDNVNSLQQLQGRYFLTTETGSQVFCSFLVGADGGNSFVRRTLSISVDRKEYSQSAVTCVLELPQAHNNTCYQSFHQNGILAFLPLANPNQVSVVWSINNEILPSVLKYDAQTFIQELYACFSSDLGVPKLVSEPSHFPLAKQYAQQIHGKNFVLLGDAAHTIHPLAGQGVNLGFADTWQFADLVSEYYRPNVGIEQSNFDAYARRRKGRATMTSEAMAIIKDTYMSRNPLVKNLRKFAMNTVDNVSYIKNAMINYALGYGEIPYSKASFDSKVDLDALKLNTTTLDNVGKVLQKLPLDRFKNTTANFFSNFKSNSDSSDSK